MNHASVFWRPILHFPSTFLRNDISMIIVERATIDDTQGIEDVFYKTWLFVYPNRRLGITEEDIREYFKDIYSEATHGKIMDHIFSSPDDELLLVAKENDMVVGVCRAIKKEEYNELDAEYVLPEYQGHGIGSLFWEKVKTFLGTKKDIIVRVPVYNIHTIRFFIERGFVDVGKRIEEERFRMPISKKIIPHVELVLKAYSQ